MQAFFFRAVIKPKLELLSSLASKHVVGVSMCTKASTFSLIRHLPPLPFYSFLFLSPHQLLNPPEEIESMADSYFQRIYTAEQSIDEVIAMLERFKTSPDTREQEIFACMVHNLFDEYRFFHNYPEKELRITGILFGSLIQHQLVSSITLGIALRYVLEALRRPPGPDNSGKMFRFGMFALEQFKGRLGEWPQYCSHIVQIPHLVTNHAALVEEIERSMQRQGGGAGGGGGGGGGDRGSLLGSAGAVARPPQAVEDGGVAGSGSTLGGSGSPTGPVGESPVLRAQQQQQHQQQRLVQGQRTPDRIATGLAAGGIAQSPGVEQGLAGGSGGGGTDQLPGQGVVGGGSGHPGIGLRGIPGMGGVGFGGQQQMGGPVGGQGSTRLLPEQQQQQGVGGVGGGGGSDPSSIVSAMQQMSLRQQHQRSAAAAAAVAGGGITPGSQLIGSSTAAVAAVAGVAAGKDGGDTAVAVGAAGKLGPEVGGSLGGFSGLTASQQPAGPGQRLRSGVGIGGGVAAGAPGHETWGTSATGTGLPQAGTGAVLIPLPIVAENGAGGRGFEGGAVGPGAPTGALPVRVGGREGLILGILCFFLYFAWWCV